MLFHCLNATVQDVDGISHAFMFGRDRDGLVVSYIFPFRLHFYFRGESDIFEKYDPDNRCISSTERFTDIRGYGRRQEKFTKLSFESVEQFGHMYFKLSWAGYPNHKMDVFNHMEPKYQLFHHLGGVCSWFEIPDNIVETQFSKLTRATHEFSGRSKPLRRDDIEDVCPLKILSWDIETYSSTGLFPNPEIEEDVIIQIGASVQTFGRGITKQICFSLPPINQVSEIVLCNTEQELLLKFREFVLDQDPDFVTGWNVNSFDNRYIFKRNKVDALFDIGRIIGRHEKPYEKELKSAALGDNELFIWPMSGRFVFDLMQRVKAEKELEAYNLDFVSSALLGDKKDDVTPHEMFQAYRTKNVEEMTRVARYCIKDTELPLKIMEKMKTVNNYLEMCRATFIGLSDISDRGQQIKIFSLLVYTSQKMGYLVMNKKPVKKADLPTEQKAKESFQGATVLEPIKGAYYVPITALDFASLYPSIMRAHNLCFTTLVPDGMSVDVECEEFFIHGPDKPPVRFVKNSKSVLPKILDDLAVFRKRAKKDMANAKGTPLEAVFNARQLSMKLVMNSLYGFCGCGETGMFPEKKIAAAVTCKGRQMIEETKAIVEKNFANSTVVYGDSVAGETPLLLRRGGSEVFIATIESLADKWSPAHGGKESCELVDLESWTDEGWTPVHRVIRHALAPHKNMMCITTHTGVVTCTDDHSLIRHNGLTVSPKDLEVGDKLLARPLDGEVTGTVVTEIAVLLWVDQFVYDLTTENHHFQAGTGDLIVHNTDSVMVKFDLPDSLTTEEKIREAWRLGEMAAAMCKFPPPNDLELEKVYCPYLLLSKKRYAAKLYTCSGENVNFEYIDAKGIQSVRRDHSPFVRKTCQAVLDILLEERNILPAISFIRSTVDSLLSGQIPIEDLIESRKLASDGFKTECGPDNLDAYEELNRKRKLAGKREVSVYKKRALPHVKVRDDCWRRSPGSEPNSGERVRFVICMNGGTKMSEKAEDVDHAVRESLTIDNFYYIGKLKAPLKDLLEPLGQSVEELFPQDPKLFRPKTIDECRNEDDIEMLNATVLKDFIKKNCTRSAIISGMKKTDLVKFVINLRAGRELTVETAESEDELNTFATKDLKAFLISSGVTVAKNSSRKILVDACLLTKAKKNKMPTIANFFQSSN